MKNVKSFMLQTVGLALFVSLLTGQTIPAQSKPHHRSGNSLAGMARAARPHQADDTAPVTDDDRWDDGFGFSASQSQVDYYDKVKAIAVIGKDLYVGGRFEEAGGVHAEGIAKWNGERWSDLNGGVNDCKAYSCYPTVNSLAVQGTDLIAGGNFVHIGGVETNKVARWDGKNWSALGSGANGPIYKVAVHGNDVYAGGDFTEIGGVQANYIAKWDGKNWSAIGSGVDGYVLAIAIRNNEVFVGGKFTKAGGKTAFNFARWVGPVVTPPPPPVLLPQISSISIRRKLLTVTGERFDEGAKILLNGEVQKTVNDTEQPTMALVAKKSGKKVKSGDRLQVQNRDGKLSPDFIVTP